MARDPASIQPVANPVLSTPTKPSFRRPALVRKRDDTDLDVEGDTIPQSPSKRTKVTFDADVEVRVMDQWEKAPEVVREEVRRALERHAIGDDAAYDQVKEVYTANPIAEDAPSSRTLRNYTAALLSKVSSLNRSCSGLVHAVLESEWLGRDATYLALFVRFLGSLISAQGMYLGDVIHMLVENLTYGKPVIIDHSYHIMLSQISAPPSSSQLPQQCAVIRSVIHRRTHATLKYLLRLIPSASSVLSSVLISLFPHPSSSKRAYVVYVRNLLQLIEYAPELESEILALITERLVKIDVQVQVDLEDLAEDVGDGVVQGIPKLEIGISEDVDAQDDEDDKSDTESEVSDDESDPDVQRAKDITANVEKMDIILDVLFSHYTPLFSGTLAETREAAFDVLLTQFATIILPTYRSRHTQFLLFHFAQTSPALIDNFVGACAHIAFDKGRPSIIRQSAATYLASFVARGEHVSSQIVRDVFDYIGSQLSLLRSDHEPTCRGPDLRRYSSYYSLVQALLYIFCFRWRDLEAAGDEEAEDDDLPITDLQEHAWIPGIKETLAQNVFSVLNPLKVCSPAIVDEFAKIANHLELIYVYHLLETNKRLRLSQFSGSLSRNIAYSQPERETALSVRKDESYQQLDEYFPFDPYHLPRSKRWIEGDYREWKGIPGLDERAEGESGSEDEEESEGESEADDEDMGTDAGSMSS